jgi:hypothetical protein
VTASTLLILAHFSTQLLKSTGTGRVDGLLTQRMPLEANREILNAKVPCDKPKFRLSDYLICIACRWSFWSDTCRDPDALGSSLSMSGLDDQMCQPLQRQR